MCSRYRTQDIVVDKREIRDVGYFWVFLGIFGYFGYFGGEEGNNMSNTIDSGGLTG